MKYYLKIDLQGLPRTVNSIGRLHWAVKAKETRYWIDCVALYVINKKPLKPLPKVRLRFTRFSSRQPDFDNLVNSFKAVQDGLVVSGILQNDKPENIETPEYIWQKACHKKGQIRIEVWEA